MFVERSDDGHTAWVLDHLGLAAFGRTREEAVARAAEAIDDHRRWCRVHRLPFGPASTGGVSVVEVTDDVEAVFSRDVEPAADAEIVAGTVVLAATRADLLTVVGHLPDEVLDWDPPYRRFASSADNRTIRENLAHLANGETHHFLRAVGHRSPRPAAMPAAIWPDEFAERRREAMRFLQDLARSPDRARVTVIEGPTGAPERWSVRKAMRRMVRHEILHTKSIRRIVAAYPG